MQGLAPQFGIGRSNGQRRLVQAGPGEDQAVGIDGDVADRRAHLHRNRHSTPKCEMRGVRRKLKLVMQWHHGVGQDLARAILGLRHRGKNQENQRPKAQTVKPLHRRSPGNRAGKSIRAAWIFNAGFQDRAKLATCPTWPAKSNCWPR